MSSCSLKHQTALPVPHHPVPSQPSAFRGSQRPCESMMTSSSFKKSNSQKVLSIIKPKPKPTNLKAFPVLALKTVSQLPTLHPHTKPSQFAFLKHFVSMPSDYFFSFFASVKKTFLNIQSGLTSNTFFPQEINQSQPSSCCCSSVFLVSTHRYITPESTEERVTLPSPSVVCLHLGCCIPTWVCPSEKQQKEVRGRDRETDFPA